MPQGVPTLRLHMVDPRMAWRTSCCQAGETLVNPESKPEVQEQKGMRTHALL